MERNAAVSSCECTHLGEVWEATGKGELIVVAWDTILQRTVVVARCEW